MIKVEKQIRDGKKGVFLIIKGDNEELYNDFRALYSNVINDDGLFKIAQDALDSVKMDLIIQNFKEKK